MLYYKTMDSKTIVMCVVALLLGMLMAKMLKDVCGCNVVEGNPGDCYSIQDKLKGTHIERDIHKTTFALGMPPRALREYAQNRCYDSVADAMAVLRHFQWVDDDSPHDSPLANVLNVHFNHSDNSDNSDWDSTLIFRGFGSQADFANSCLDSGGTLDLVNSHGSPLNYAVDLDAFPPHEIYKFECRHEDPDPDTAPAPPPATAQRCVPDTSDRSPSVCLDPPGDRDIMGDWTKACNGCSPSGDEDCASCDGYFGCGCTTQEELDDEPADLAARMAASACVPRASKLLTDDLDGCKTLDDYHNQCRDNCGVFDPDSDSYACDNCFVNGPKGLRCPCDSPPESGS